LFQYQKFKGDLIVNKMFDIETSACASILPPSPVSLHPFPLIYVVMIVVNTIPTFVLLRDGNLIFWWASVIHV
jgi:hypothetical protein